MSSGDWRALPANLSLPRGEVHVIRLQLDRDEGDLAQLATLLSAEESERAGRFLRERDRRRYMACRGVLRTLLGRYLQIEPAAVQFAYGQYGKPFLDPSLGAGDLQFNVAHSKGLALLAFGREFPLGVDVEYPRSMRDADRIVETRFSVREGEAYRALAAEQKVEGFFNCWTRKEAFIKGTGMGMYALLSKFSVSLAPGEKANLLSTEEDESEAPRWSLRALDPGDGAFAALAVRGHGWRLNQWDWPD